MELHERLQQAGAPIEVRPDSARDPFAEVKNRIHLALVSELGPRLFDVSDGDAGSITVPPVLVMASGADGRSRSAP